MEPLTAGPSERPSKPLGSAQRVEMSGGLDIEIHESREHPLGMFFKSLRQTRRELYASWEPGMGAEKRRAVLTLVQDEAILLPIWLRYYSRFFAPDDIYVLDHQSTDGSTDGNGFVRIPVEHETFDNTWMRDTVQAHQHELLERYDVVLAADVDEIVAPRPDWGTLGDFIDRFDEAFVNCLGYEMLHLKDREGPLRTDRPIMAQRRYWFSNDAYDKAALATEPMAWELGRHPPRLGENLDPDLYLIHLHRVDYDICQTRHRRWHNKPWNERDLKEGWATNNRIIAGEEFERWFYRDDSWFREDDRGQDVSDVVEKIPAVWRDAF
jgi:hypothetical protein